ncbi:pseudouridine synthase [Daejeonella sp. H1SJ63]|jgi:23S rRNA pseudouridine2605 synthase|uniref:pseudouridine synthase n=1 Tax=Daejeonella sp. H1SJ63 TaxID=3034145 RepID=UPI0023EE1FC3|nr:pseudouridine synthase [Daejeonella sp. H1SJ63]
MPFKNKRNSRDDKSEKSNRTTGSSSKSNSFRPERTEGTNNIKKKLFSDDSRKPFKSGFKKSDEKSGSGFSSEKRNPGSFSSSSEERQGKRNFRERSQSESPAGGRRKFSEGGEKKNFGDKPQSDRKVFSGSKGADRKPFAGRDNKFADKNAPKRFNDKPFKSRAGSDSSSSERPRFRSDDKKWSSEERFVNKRPKKATVKDDGLIRLNRFIANAGICSRRKADELIAAGVVSVNGEPVTELGFKVDPAKDSIRYNGETLKREKMVYVLLNKPKDYITTTDDPQERKTVMNLVEKASRERIYPVGRLDRNTTGLLLMTNDGDLAEKLSHPRNNITKLYQVELNKSLSQGDMNKIAFGIELEDGVIKPDQVSYVAGGSKKEVGIQIHSGKNRVVRRIFESLGYEVVKLDRVVYSNLTKKDLPRGRWRYLDEKEIIQLKHLIK